MSEPLNLLTAAEAMKLATKNPIMDTVQAILADVKRIAEDVTLTDEYRRKFITREYGFGDVTWYGGSEESSPFHKSVLDFLRGLGYQCSVKTVESQFVDIYLEVTW